MMRLILFLTEETIKKLRRKFPRMLEVAKEVEVLPWQDEYAVADYNPEVIDSLEFLRMLLKSGLITEEEYYREREKFSFYASKTLGVAFIEERKVSFREKRPSQYVVLHELGHIYFEATDLEWNAQWGGGEILFSLALEEKYHIEESHIKRYHHLVKSCYEKPEKVHQFIISALAPKLHVYPHLFPICLFSGYVPEVLPEFYELDSPKWQSVKVEPWHLFTFFQNLVDGLIYKDGISIFFAKELSIVG